MINMAIVGTVVLVVAAIIGGLVELERRISKLEQDRAFRGRLEARKIGRQIDALHERVEKVEDGERKRLEAGPYRAN